MSETMSVVHENLYYTPSHEWVRIDGDTARVGITDFAQEQLTDVVFVELPSTGRKVKQSEPCAVVESCKVAADVYAPLSGTITAVNGQLGDAPEKVNQDPFGEGWFFEIRIDDKNETAKLLKPDQYKELCKG